jgi:cob(I)alamin adenosyltransferase
MGNRLSKIYTRTGDDGTTGLASGERVAKTDARIEACGAVDETSCAIGVVLAEPTLPDDVRVCLTDVQHHLFEVGAELAFPDYAGVDDESVARLERDLDSLNAALPPLKEFILPGGNRAAAACHMARAVCRRAERRLWELAAGSSVNPVMPRYLNRLSDLLFVIARVIGRSGGGQEVLWKHSRRD